MSRALVTGSAGFIGFHLSRVLLDRGFAVRGFDNFLTGDPARIEELAERRQFEFQEGDLRDEDDVEVAMSDIDLVFHQAAIRSVPRSVDNPKMTASSNCIGTTNILVAARDAAVESVVVASSSSVYGSVGNLPRTEDQSLNPESPYGLSKHWTDRLTVQFSDLYGLETVALRYFNIFGPGQNPDGQYAAVIPKFINLMLDGERPVVYGDGEQSRDFTYIQNAIQANLAAANSDCSGEALNVACGGNITVNELVDHLNRILGTGIEPIYEDPRPGDVRHSHADISKARDLIGYDPSVDFSQGLEQTVSAFED